MYWGWLEGPLCQRWPPGADPVTHATGNPEVETHSSDPYLPLDEQFDDRKLFAFKTTAITSLLPWAIEDILLPWRRQREFTGFDDGEQLCDICMGAPPLCSHAHHLVFCEQVISSW